MTMRQTFVRAIDGLWREPLMILKYYLNHAAKHTSPKNVFMVDGKVGHGGNRLID